MPINKFLQLLVPKFIIGISFLRLISIFFCKIIHSDQILVLKNNPDHFKGKYSLETVVEKLFMFVLRKPPILCQFPFEVHMLFLIYSVN